METLYKERLIEDGSIVDLFLSTNGNMRFWLENGKRSVFVEGYSNTEVQDELKLTICEKDKDERVLHLTGWFDGSPHVGTGDRGAYLIIPGFKGYIHKSAGFDSGRDLTDSEFAVKFDAHLLNYKATVDVAEVEEE